MENPSNGVNVPLSTFGGLSTELSPSDLPEGGSPDNQDIAYYPGGAETRPGMSQFRVLPDGSPVVYMNTFTKRDGTVFNVFMGANGKIWAENFTLTPTTLTQVGKVPAGSLCKSVSAYGRLYMAFNNGFRGTDITRQFDGTTFDRVSQEGPGKNTCTVLDYQGTVDLVSVKPAAPPSNIISAVTTNGMAIITTQTPHGLSVGDYAVISGVSVAEYNATIVVASAPTPSTFTFEIVTSPSNGSGGICYPLTMIAVTGEPHGLFVGDSFSISGNSNSAFNNGSALTPGFWTVSKVIDPYTFEFVGSVSTGTPGGTAVAYVNGKSQPWNPTANPAYDFGAHDGTGPTQVTLPLIAGQQIAVTATGQVHWANSHPYVGPDGVAGDVTGSGTAGGDVYPSAYMVDSWTAVDGTARSGLCIAALCGCFVDVTGAFVQAVPIGSSALITVPANAVALQLGINDQYYSDNAGSFTATVALRGGASGGTGGFVNVGGAVTGGQHQLVVIFQTRNGYLTRPSDPIKFSTTGGKKIQISNIPLGPTNVVARILAFTGVDGDRWFYLPIAPRVGGDVLGTSTVVSDNVSTSAILDFSDASLFGGIAIDVDGNNLFNLQVLGNCSGVSYYGDRMVFWGDENTVQNLKNMDFEGGYDPTTLVPYGWTLVSGNGWSIGPTGADFGTCITIPSGVTFAIQQPCSRDYYGAEILNPNTQYTFKCWASAVHGATIKATILDGDTGTQLASAVITASALSGFVSAKFSAKTPQKMPDNALLLVQVINSANGTSLVLDKMSMIYSDKPYNDTFAWMSYVINPESVDGVTGVLGASDDPAPIMDCGEVRDELAFVTRDTMQERGSLHTTRKLDGSEPSGWTVTRVSHQVGACSMFTMISGQGWICWASSDGARMYDGTMPSKITQDVQSFWEAIRPESLLFVFAVHDPANRRIYWGVQQ